MSESQQVAPKFGTFTGVFTPTLLTILGVIMYVRIGWVVGNAGVAGAMAIMGLGLLITACTGLSLSSIATNTRIGAGGPYAIMNRSLGLEVGGAIGIPLYLTRPLGVAMYVFGFREGVQWVVPGAPALVTDFIIFGLLFALAYKSADLAFKAQYVIMGVIALSLVSIFASPAAVGASSSVPWIGEYPGAPERGFEGTNFWGVFAVFFPATTGILAGANMSGDLKDPRRAIPVGTLAAIAVSAVVYFLVAIWVSRLGTAEELASNYNVLIDKAWSPGLVLAGLLGATASSALAGLVGGPRILMAMGENRIVPFSKQMAETSDGEPRNAMMVTGVLTVLCIMVRDLNAIAPLVTMFFLITYCMINVVVLFEDGLGLVSYRPTLRVPR
ncbi:MAG: Na-K-Cl cotransporter, partial [Proteobacteria bacterium]|nr:Na-K-Cl cotransporter [Pseudomonadota bacterium]